MEGKQQPSSLAQAVAAVAVSEHVCIPTVSLRACFMLHSDTGVHESGVVFVFLRANLFLEVVMSALMSYADLEGGQKYSCQENSGWKSNIVILKFRNEHKVFSFLSSS